MIDGGVWKHYKGGLYRVICRGRDADTGEIVIAYQDIGTGRIYMRAEAAWREIVDGRDGLRQPRFRRVSEEPPPPGIGAFLDVAAAMAVSATSAPPKKRRAGKSEPLPGDAFKAAPWVSPTPPQAANATPVVGKCKGCGRKHIVGGDHCAQCLANGDPL